MKYAFVLANDGTRLMPTPFAKARKLINKGKAVIEKHNPFTIRLTKNSTKHIQQIELCMDTGSEHIGVSIKSQRHEYIHAQYDNLTNEKEKHQAQVMYRRTRRNKLRYRKARFKNRNKPQSWLAPTVLHKKNNHVQIAKKYTEVCPVETAILEVGQFDPALMQSLEETGAVLTGTDYQQGKKYKLPTTREAVFVRDDYTCQICGKSIKDKAILHAHHIIPRSQGGSDRLNNLLTVCNDCHTAKNHQPGGKLFGLKPVTRPLKDATFMNIVRWRIVNEIKENLNIQNIEHTYGAYTKLNRRNLGQLPKTHANDAYAMGKLHPKHRTQETLYKKRRRNNRCMQKFYDAKYIDSRDNSVKNGSQIGTNRTNRREKRNSEKNERIYRTKKMSKGKITTRRQRYFYQPGDKVKYVGSDLQYIGRSYTVKSTMTNGRAVMIRELGRTFLPNKLKPINHIGGWEVLKKGTAKKNKHSKVM